MIQEISIERMSLAYLTSLSFLYQATNPHIGRAPIALKLSTQVIFLPPTVSSPRITNGNLMAAVRLMIQASNGLRIFLAQQCHDIACAISRSVIHYNDFLMTRYRTNPFNYPSNGLSLIKRRYDD